MPPDLRYGLRVMAKSPGFTTIAVLTLALGIGGNTAVFSVIDTLLLRPLPLRDPGRLVQISAVDPQRGLSGGPSSVAAYETIRDRNTSFDGVAASVNESFTLTGNTDPEQLAGARVSPNFFDVLGARPLRGRSFQSAEGEPGGQPVAIISYGLWQRRFASDPAITGKPMTLNSDVYTIIGVMPRQFSFPSVGIDVWVTRVTGYTGLQPYQIQHGAGFLISLARLKPGVSIERATANVAVLFQQYRQEHPASPDANVNGRLDVAPLRDVLVSDVRPTLLILSGAIGLVLLIACANLASLLLARATGRAKEIAVRSALGASRGALIRQLLAESFLLAAAGGAAGALIAAWGAQWLVSATGSNLPGFEPVHVDMQALAFTLAVSILTGVLFGLMPALQISRPDLNSVLRDSGWGTTGGAHRHRVRSLLVAGQMALSIVLLIGAGLLIESFVRLQNVNPGFDARNTLTMTVTLPAPKYPEDVRKARFFRDLIGRIETLPGVTSVSAALSLPLSANLMAPLQAEGQSPLPIGSRPLAQWNSTTPDHFKTLRIPLLQGRDFTWADDEHSPKVMIISDSMARRFWPNESPLGRTILFGRGQQPAQVVGVVGDVKNRGLAADTFMVFYTPYAQRTWNSMTISIRTANNPEALANAAPAQVHALDKDQPVTNVQTLENAVARSVAERRQTMLLIAGFAAIALLLAVIGLYGVMAYSVAQRTSEIGIRQAIGAQRGDILRLILSQGLRLTLVGISIGAVAALVLTRLISGMLFHVSATDPLTFAGISILFLAVSLAASFVPAYRATRVDPLEALRYR